MLVKSKNALYEAISTVKSRFFHTVLSVFGIIVGVAALVTVLSMIDGMERYVNEQFSLTAELNNIIVNPNLYKSKDGVSFRRDSFPELSYDLLQKAKAELDFKKGQVIIPFPAELKYNNNYYGGIVTATTPEYQTNVELVKGQFFTDSDLNKHKAVAVVNTILADKLMNSKKWSVLGTIIYVKNRPLTIIGVEKTKMDIGEITIPFTFLTREERKEIPANWKVTANSVSEVSALEKKLKAWLMKNLKSKEEDFNIIAQQDKVKETEVAFRVFRIVMGIIVGIAIVVGGVGVMNVLLISVKERTSEIGIRKAMGATKRDLIKQFLFESIALSSIGSLLGLLSGIGLTLIAGPLIKSYTQAPFEPTFTFFTLMVIGIITVLVGVIFGTFPAMKAAQLDPVEAIRRE